MEGANAMHRFAFAVPELPGKDSRTVSAFVKSRFEEYVASRKRLGITMERVCRMQTPMGPFVIAYIEAARSFAETNKGLGTSPDPFDREFARRLADVHGLDPTKPAPGTGPELLADWWDPDVKERRRGLAFVAPVAPGKTAEGRRFAATALRDRGQEFAASRRALGQNGEAIFLNATPQGDFICVYLEGRDPASANRQFAASRGDFDVWFKGECRKVFPADIDFNQPLPPIEQIHDWKV
jgi:hypothetical protein